MEPYTDLAPTISTEATLPASSASDGQSATGRSIAEIIAADQYTGNKVAIAQRRRGMVFTKIIPPGAFTDRCGPRGFGHGSCYL